MTNQKDAPLGMSALGLTLQNAQKAGKNSGDVLTGLMSDPAYLRQSSALINDALQKGFDILQLPSGDIVATGTKTVVYQYSWDEEKQTLTRSKASDTLETPSMKSKVKVIEDADEGLSLGS